MPNLVLGIIENVDRKYVEPFINSLRGCGYDDEVVLFAKNVSKDAREFLTRNKVRLLRYRAIRLPRGMWFLRRSFIKLYSKLFRGKFFPFQETVIKLFWHCQSARYYYFYDFLLKSPVKYKMILLCDVRDTVFQRYPFPGDIGSDICCFEEYFGYRICDRPVNCDWLRLIGEDIPEKIGDKRVICSGAVLGTHDGILRYIRAMKEHLWKFHWPRGYDQGILNFLVHLNHLTGVKAVPYGEGPVMHIAIAPRDKINTGEGGEVLLNDGSVCPVVHQYDRHPDIMAGMLKKYRTS